MNDASKSPSQTQRINVNETSKHLNQTERDNHEAEN